MYLVLCYRDSDTTSIIHRSPYDSDYIWQKFEEKVKQFTNSKLVIEEALAESGLMAMFFAFSRVVKLCDKQTVSL
jgi:hypothetical protein